MTMCNGHSKADEEADPAQLKVYNITTTVFPGQVTILQEMIHHKGEAC